jgi:hypothetical protein
MRQYEQKGIYKDPPYVLLPKGMQTYIIESNWKSLPEFKVLVMAD